VYPLRHYLHTCLTRRVLVETEISDVYCTPSVASKMRAPRTRRRSELLPLLELSDFFVGTYSSLNAARATARLFSADTWSCTEIHHIVENYHLQFLALVLPVNSLTYDVREPCVLLCQKHHSLHMENIIGVAETVIMETRPFNFIDAFRQMNPGLSRRTRDEKARLRTEWVRDMESLPTPPITRQEIRDTLIAIYDFAYQEPEVQPLRMIARAVIQGMPLTWWSPRPAAVVGS
jgi:hypothetical protein